MAKKKTKQTKEVEDQFEQEVFSYKSKNELSRVLTPTFGIAAFFSSILFMMGYDPFTDPFPLSIYLVGFFIMASILFAIVSHLSIKYIEVPYEKSCKTCLYCNNYNTLDRVNHSLSKIYFCTKFDRDGKDVPLDIFMPCKRYELDQIVIRDYVQEQKDKKNDRGLK